MRCAGGGSRGQQPPRLGDAGGERLLDQDVATGLERVERRLTNVVGRADDHCVDLVPASPGRYRDAEPLGQLGVASGVGLHDPRQLHVRKGGDELGVQRAHQPSSDDADPHQVRSPFTVV
jgi:hypothetical protein